MSSMQGPYGWNPMEDPLYHQAAAPMMPAAATPAQAPVTVPAAAPPTGFLHTVVAGDTIWKLAQRYGVSVEAILAANPGVVPENLLIGTVLRIPVPGTVTYIRYQIKPGDTLWLLGQQYGVPWQDLARINRIADPMNLMVGSIILIPVV